MIEPDAAAYMYLRHALVVRNAPSRWTASTVFHSASGNDSTRWTDWMPALLTRMSTPPNASATAATPASTARSSVTSIATPSACPPADPQPAPVHDARARATPGLPRHP